MPKNLTPSSIYKDDYKRVVLDHIDMYGRSVQEDDAYYAVRELLSLEHMQSTDPRICPEANDLLWSAPEGWKLVPEEISPVSTFVPIECIMQENQSDEYDWIYESNLSRAGLV